MKLQPTPMTTGCRCDVCPYSKDKKPNRPVLAVGLRRVEKAVGIVVGDSPGAEEVSRGELFVGPTGQELDAAFTSAGLSRESLVIVSAIACKPHEPKEDDEMEEATWACRPYVQRVFELVTLLSPRRADTPILMLGKMAYFSVTGKAGYMNERGFLQLRVTTRTIADVHQRTPEGSDARPVDAGEDVESGDVPD